MSWIDRYPHLRDWLQQADEELEYTPMWGGVPEIPLCQTEEDDAAVSVGALRPGEPLVAHSGDEVIVVVHAALLSVRARPDIGDIEEDE